MKPSERAVPSVVAAVAAGVLGACSLTPTVELGAFEVEVPLREADTLLQAKAHAHGMKVARDPDPLRRAIPRNYLGTVASGDCLLMVEGFGLNTPDKVKVSLLVAEGASCSENMQSLFRDLRRGLPRGAA